MINALKDIVIPAAFYKLPEQDQEFLKELCQKTVEDTLLKYCNGYKEHGGSLLDDNGVLDMAMHALEEAIDLNVYLRALLVIRAREIENGK